MTLDQLFGKTDRTYATHSNAVKAIEKTVAKLGGLGDDQFNRLAYVIVATPEGRFFPMVIPTEGQVQTAIILAHNGICFVRR